MPFTRRETLKFAVAGLAGAGAITVMPFAARAQGSGDTYETENGEITIFPVSHASFVMTVPGGPSLLGLPLFGLLGFLGAAVGGVWLLLSIRRSNREDRLDDQR